MEAQRRSLAVLSRFCMRRFSSSVIWKSTIRPNRSSKESDAMSGRCIWSAKALAMAESFMAVSFSMVGWFSIREPFVVVVMGSPEVLVGDGQ